MLLRIAETFYSIQGEGYWAGTAAFFIRLAGCNLRCPWCDTDHQERERCSVQNLVDRVRIGTPLGVRPMVVLTGGEPTLQQLFTLTEELHRVLQAFVAIETNGSHLEGIHGICDWLTISPKPGLSYDLTTLAGSELKVVMSADVEHSVLRRMREVCVFQHYFIQPCHGDPRSMQRAVNFVKENPAWRLSLQMQRYADIK